jgi:hypothetical protein
MDYQKASRYWIDKEKDSVKMDKLKLLERIDAFLKEHNTMALATGYQDKVRCTPLEYNYYDGFFYVFSEGGEKFVGLEKNSNVSAAIFDSYTGFGSIHSLQVTGHVEIIDEDSDEFEHVATKKGLNMKAVRKMGVSFHLLKIVPEMYEFLDSDLKKEGYSNRQRYVFD